MAISYRGYTIRPVQYQGCNNYQITPPDGRQWPDIACNMQIALRWINEHIAEQRERAAAQR